MATGLSGLCVGHNFSLFLSQQGPLGLDGKPVSILSHIYQVCPKWKKQVWFLTLFSFLSGSTRSEGQPGTSSHASYSYFLILFNVFSSYLKIFPIINPAGLCICPVRLVRVCYTSSIIFTRPEESLQVREKPGSHLTSCSTSLVIPMAHSHGGSLGSAELSVEIPFALPSINSRLKCWCTQRHAQVQHGNRWSRANGLHTIWESKKEISL